MSAGGMRNRMAPPPLPLGGDDEPDVAEVKAFEQYTVGASLAPSTASDEETRVHEDELKMGRVLGRGASGVVCLATHLPTGKLYAHKTVSLSMDRETRRKVQDEALLTMSANHPHVVRMVEARIGEGSVRYVMEYMDRGSLQDLYLATGAVAREDVLAAIAKQAVLGLQHLHRVRRVMHRDVKPANLLLDSKGMVKIADLGVGVTIKNTTDVAESWVGTVTYMAPERIRGQKYTMSSDMWSLGLTLAECAVGEFPYCKTCGKYPRLVTFWDVLNTVCTMAPPSLPRDRFSPAFCDFVAICLGRTTKERPPAEVLLRHPFIVSNEGEDPQWHVQCVREYLEEVEEKLHVAMEKRIAQANEEGKEESKVYGK